MAGPATIAPNGVPVTPVESNAPVLDVVENGGFPITPTQGAAPFILRGYVPNPPIPGPLDYASPFLDSFTNFAQPFDLASPDAVLGLVCDYSGDPVISIAHGGEPLTIIKQERRGTILSLIAAGTGLTVESANLTITATGGNLNGGALRINEMKNVQTALYGWSGGNNNQSPSISLPAISGSSGGVVKVAFGSAFYDPYHVASLGNASTVWQGYLGTGADSGANTGPSGNWTLNSGWSWDGTTLKHTGSNSSASVTFTPVVGYLKSARAMVNVAAGGSVSIDIGARTSVSGPYNGPLYASIATSVSRLQVAATGDVEIDSITIFEDAHNVCWVFGTADAQDGLAITGSTTASGPLNAISAAEILGEDY